MKRERRYRSQTQRRASRRNNWIIAIVVILLIVLVAMPLLARYGPLPDALDFWPGGSTSSSQTASTDSTDQSGGFRWPWSKPRATALPEETPTPVPTNFSALEATAAPVTAEDIVFNESYVTDATPQTILLDVSIADNMQTVQVVEQIQYRNQTDRTLTEVLLHFPATSLLSNVNEPFSQVVLDGADPATAYQFTSDSSLLRLTLNSALLPQSVVRITLAYDLTIPAGTAINAVADTGLRLADFYAYPAQYQGGAWIERTDGYLPVVNITANVTAAESLNVFSSGDTITKSSVANGSRTKYEDNLSRHFAIALSASELRDDRVQIGEGDSATSVRNYAAGSSNVIRITELSAAILEQYRERFGSVSMPIVNIVASSLSTPYYVADDLIFYDLTTFTDNNEFRYQFARALAELYFPQDSSYDPMAIAFNDLLTHQLSANYVITSQGANQAEFAYAHCPEASQLSSYIQSIGAETFQAAIAQYRLNALNSSFVFSNMTDALSVESATELRTIVTAYSDRLSTGAAAPTVSIDSVAIPSPSPTATSSSSSSSALQEVPTRSSTAQPETAEQPALPEEADDQDALPPDLLEDTLETE